MDSSAGYSVVRSTDNVEPPTSAAGHDPPSQQDHKDPQVSKTPTPSGRPLSRLELAPSLSEPQWTKPTTDSSIIPSASPTRLDHGTSNNDRPMLSPSSGRSVSFSLPISPRGGAAPEDNEDEDARVDERTAILRRKQDNVRAGDKSSGTALSYGATTSAIDRDALIGIDRGKRFADSPVQDNESTRLRVTKSPPYIDSAASNAARYRSTPRGKSPAISPTSVGPDGVQESQTLTSKWQSLIEKYGSVELENRGSVARDHLAIERTFLAWLRTALSFASIGIAITQLFRLNTSLGDTTNSSKTALPPDVNRLRSIGKPLGATFLAISILILFLGFHRYFESQHYVIQGKFPASRGSIIIVSLVACGLIVTSLVIIIAVAPGMFT